MSQRMRPWNLRADSKPCRSQRNKADDFASAKWFLTALDMNHFRCGKWGMMYLLGRSRRPRLFRPARFKKRGGRANRRRCARWRRFPSDCRVRPHSDMGNMDLCRNFSRRGTRCLAGLEQERYAPANRAMRRAKPQDGLRQTG